MRRVICLIFATVILAAGGCVRETTVEEELNKLPDGGADETDILVQAADDAQTTWQYGANPDPAYANRRTAHFAAIGEIHDSRDVLKGIQSSALTLTDEYYAKPMLEVTDPERFFSCPSYCRIKVANDGNPFQTEFYMTRPDLPHTMIINASGNDLKYIKGNTFSVLLENDDGATRQYTFRLTGLDLRKMYGMTTDSQQSLPAAP